MHINDIFDGKRQDGFFRIGSDKPPELTKEQRVALNRKGNEFFNKGDYAAARRIFLTTRYGDGLIRLGDYHYKKREPLEAFWLYRLAREKVKTDQLVEKMACVIREWLHADDAGPKGV